MTYQSTRRRRAVIAIALCLGLAGCDMLTEVPDTSNMPEVFGKLESKFIGCADVVGLYAWPPTLGKAYVPSDSRGNQNFLGVPTFNKAQIWIKGPYKSGPQMTVLSRMVNTNPNYHNSLTREWSYQDYEKNQTHCKGGWLVLPDVPNEDPSEPKNYAAKRLVMGGKIGRLKDGGLVVGQRVTVSGQTGSYFSWGGQSYGSYKVADHDIWYWTKLERIGPTGEGVKPDDASLNRDAKAEPAAEVIKPNPIAEAIEPKRDVEIDEARQAAQDRRIDTARKAAEDRRVSLQR